jgi:hypothetical protein
MKKYKVKFTYGQRGVTCVEGEALHTTLSRALNSGEPIQGGAVLNTTEKKAGVLPEFDIRTDRFEQAMAAGDAVVASNVANRETVAKMKDIEENPDKYKVKEDNGAEDDNNSSSSSSS